MGDSLELDRQVGIPGAYEPLLLVAAGREHETVTSNYLIRNAGIIAVWRGMGVVSGAVLDAVILAYFGLGNETDALFASLAIPYLITSALELQAPKILIPAFTDCMENEGEKATFELVSNLISVFGAILCSASMILLIFA